MCYSIWFCSIGLPTLSFVSPCTPSTCIKSQIGQIFIPFILIILYFISIQLMRIYLKGLIKWHF